MSADAARSKLAAGRALFDAGNFPGAERVFREALAADPEFGAAHALLSLALYRRGQFRPALHAANNAVAAQPTALAFRVKALALGKLGRRRDAIEAAQAAVRLAPADEHAALVLGIALESSGKAREAEVAFRRAVELAPADDGIRADLGCFLLRQRRLAAAEQVAAEIDGAADVASVLLLRGQISLRRRRPEEARDFALWLLSRNATDPSALRLLTQVKASRSLWLGLWWRYASFMAMRPLWLRLLTIVPVMLILFALARPFALLAILYLRAAGWVFTRMVRNELRTVKLRQGF